MKNYFKHNISGKIFVIRPLKKEDVEELFKFMNELSKEKTYILMQGEKITRKEAEEFIQKIKKNTRLKKEMCLAAFYQDKLVGIASVRLLSKIYAHIGKFSILIKKEFRGCGLGKILTEKILEESLKLTGIKKILLQVFKNNIPAINLYKKFDFKESGLLPKAIKWRGKYIDEITMYKDIN